MKPYTYIIGWTNLNQFYYGVRYGNKLEPEKDLWLKYFTSSKHVKKFRKLHGEPDLIKIDVIFDNREEAYQYEQSFLRKILQEDNWDNWLNKALGFGIIMDSEIRNSINCTLRSPEMKQRAREKAHKQFSNIELKEKHKKACIPHKDKIWINDGNIHKRVTEDVFIKEYLNWNRGRIIPKDSKFGNYNKSGENNPFYGKSHSKETKDKISNTKKRNNDGS